MIHRARRWVMRFDLSDEDWAVLEPLLPKSRKRARVDDRKIMNAIFYVLRTGMPWRDLPARYGPYTTAYMREGSATHLRWFGVELSEQNGLAMYVPKGFAHGYQALTDG